MAWNKCRSQVPFPNRAVRAQESFTLWFFTDSDALFHLDFSLMCCLTMTMGLVICTKANRRVLLFLPLWYMSWSRCVVGGWNDSVDSTCLSAGFDPMGARPWLDESPPLSPYLSLQGQARTAGQAFLFFFFFWKFCAAMPPGFRWAFCSLCRQNAGCGLRNNTAFREQQRNCT